MVANALAPDIVLGEQPDHSRHTTDRRRIGTEMMNGLCRRVGVSQKKGGGGEKSLPGGSQREHADREGCARVTLALGEDSTAMTISAAA